MRTRFVSIGAVLIVAALLMLLAFVLVEDGPGRYFAALGILTLVVGLLQWLGVSRAPPPAPTPPPDLVVEFRNRHPSIEGRPALTRNADAHDLQVWIVNNGRGAAEAVEVTFDGGAAVLHNESGNNPDYHHLDPTVHPYRWMGRERTIAPGDSVAVALLSWRGRETRRPTELTWTTRARNMAPKRGVVEIELLDTAPGT